MQKSQPRRTSVWILALAAFGVAGIAGAVQPAADRQPAQKSLDQPSPAPADAARSTAVRPFASSLEGYRPYRADEPLRPWREVNDEAGQLGGHVGQLDARSRPDVRSPHAHH